MPANTYRLTVEPVTDYELQLLLGTYIKGDNAGFGTLEAEVDNHVGTPSVNVETSGPDTAKNIKFIFKNLKGDTGEQGPEGPEPQLSARPDGTILSDGNVLTEVIKDTVEHVAAEEGTPASPAGDGTRWGAYKTAENARTQAYGTAEGNSSSPKGNGSRWGAYKLAEEARDAARLAAEGNDQSPAGNGTRWGAYKTAEAARDAARLAAEGSSSSAAGDGTRWGAYKTAEAARNQEYETAEGTKDGSIAGDGSRWGAYKTAEAERSAELEDLKDKVEELLLGSHDHMAAAWAAEQLAPAAVSQMGDKNIINYDFFLIDHTRNTGSFSVPVGKLKRNNLLRFEDGRYAPAVGITQAMYDECMTHDLYIGASLYCASGAFDPVDFYENHCAWAEDGNGVVRLTHDTLSKDTAGGTEVSHYLLPWETKETKYSIMLGVEHSLYMMQNVPGASGKRWNFISIEPKSWDGVNAIELKPTAFAPSPVAVIVDGNNKRFSRSFFYAYDGVSAVYGNGADGDSGALISMMKNTGRTFPASSVMSQITSMQYARNDNAVANSPVPFAEGGWHALNTFLSYLEIKYDTRDLHNVALFGSGISTNDSCSNESQWLANGGVRCRKQGDTAWEYRTWGATSAIVKKNAQADAPSSWSAFVNNYHPKEACMESQVAASIAVEADVAAGTPFEAYGEVYTWGAVTGAADLQHGHMNAIIRSVRTGTFNAYDANGDAATFELELSLRMSLCEGANISGDIFSYWGGGMEAIGTNISATSGHTGDPVDLYAEPDQEKWVNDTDYAHNDGSPFVAESHYEKIGEGSVLGGGYSLDDIPMTPWPKKNGGGLHTAMCHYCYNTNYWSTTVGARVRIGVRFRGFAYSGLCAPRDLYANSNAAYTDYSYGGSAQVRLPEGAAPLQAE